MLIHFLRTAALASPASTGRGWMSIPFPVMLVCILAFVSGCGDDAPPPSEEESAGEAAEPPGHAINISTGERLTNVRTIECGLTDAEEQDFYHLSMGSELFPLRWMQNLINTETGKPFLKNVERFGLVPDPMNRNGLPIGLTAADSMDVRGVGKMVGMNCSACHTGIIAYDSTAVIIVGGASQFDAKKFLDELFGSASATAKDPEKLVHFVHRLWNSGRGKELPEHEAATRLLSHLLNDAAGRKSLADELKSLAKNATDAAPGDLMGAFQRLAGHAKKDLRSGLLHGMEQKVKGSFSKGLSELKADLKGIPDDLKTKAIKHLSEDFFIVAKLLSGRIAYARKLAALQELNLKSTDAGPGRADDFGAGRNLLFPPENAEPMTGACSIPPLFDVEGVQWADWDGNTSSTMGRSMLTALAGGAAFNPETFTSTVSTKNLAKLEELAAKLKPPAWPTDVLGSLDPKKLTAGEALFKEHCAKCHRPAMVDAKDAPPDSIYPLSELKTDPNRLQNYLKPLGGKNFAETLQKTSQAYLDAANRDAGISPAEAEKMNEGHPNAWRDTDGYVARCLKGIWSTAPYLHNGSVPTLWHLLSPAKSRPEKFATGDSHYDPEKVGYVFEVKKSSLFVFDTTRSGNSNSGHEYGTDLSDVEKTSLIEFLKSL